MPALQPLSEAWRRRTPREQYLALAVAGLLVLFVIVVLSRGALATIARLDGEINRLQSDIVNYSYQIARRQSVEARFSEVAAQHSSEWTESEIRDRLRQEIYRLSYRKPPRLDANGIPVTTEGGGDALVNIPELRGGHLADGGDGFREYQIEFDVPPVPFVDMLAYLEYLQGSPQSLRIDRIDLRRDPQRTEVAARIGLARVIVDDPTGGVAPDILDTDMAFTTLPLRPEEWVCEECDVSVEGDVLRFMGRGSGGRAYLPRSLPAAGRYEIELEVAASVPATLGAGHDGQVPEGGGITIAGDRAYYRCRFEYTVPATGDDRVSVALPYLAWTAPQGAVSLRNLRVAGEREENDGA